MTGGDTYHYTNEELYESCSPRSRYITVRAQRSAPRPGPAALHHGRRSPRRAALADSYGAQNYISQRSPRGTTSLCSPLPSPRR